MEPTRPHPKRSAGGAVRDRLEAARHRSFVGRAAEVELFRAALDVDEPPFTVMFVHGLGGVGKTALLLRFADIAVEAGVECLRVDGRDIEATPNGFLTALRAVLDIEGDPVQALSDEGQTVLLVDTYESVTGLEAWLQDDLLPQLSAQTLVVMASRQPPSPGWFAEPGWRDLVHVVPLRNLDPEEAAAYLRLADVPAELHRQLIGLTHGHPMALALAVDVLNQGGGGVVLDHVQAPDVVQTLLQRFVQGVPSPLHRHALAVCAEARTTTEAVLRAALGPDDVHDLFEWLHGLSFIGSGPQGIFPHDLVRDVLVADLKWRDPEVRTRLRGRVRAHAISRMRAARGRERQLAVLDYLFTEYSDPVFRSYWNRWESMGMVLGEAATPADRTAILAMVERHEGRDSAAMAAHWFDRQPGSFTVYRSGREVLGFLGWLSLHEATTADIDMDPGTRSTWRYAVQTAPPAPGEDVTMARFMMDRDAYQAASPLFSVGSVEHVLHVLRRPGLSWDFLAVADPEFYAPIWAYVGYDREEEADFQVGDRRFAVFARDWRTAPLPPKWAELLPDRKQAAARPSGPTAGASSRLPRPEYEAAVKQALRDLRRPDLLARNPLVRSRLVRARQGDRPAPAALVELVSRAAEVLRHHPRDEKLYRVIDRTYLRPAQTQELAAELLGLPSSTYRRHLSQGVTRIGSWLWDREVAADELAAGELADDVSGD